MVDFTPDLLLVLLVHHANTQTAQGEEEPQHVNIQTEKGVINRQHNELGGQVLILLHYP